MSRKRLLEALACLASGIVGLFVPALVLAGLIITMLVAVIGSEYVAAARRRARGEPSPRESLEASVARRDRGS